VLHRTVKQIGDRGQADVRVTRTSLSCVAGSVTGPKWSKNTNGPTARAATAGSSRRTVMPPGSWVS
jgi:hypothetical protein